MPAQTALEALTMRPTQLLRSSWPWRSALYLASGALLGCAVVTVTVAVVTGDDPAARGLAWLFGLVALVTCGVALARLERWRVQLVDRHPLDNPHRPVDRPGWRSWLRVRLREQVTWREIGYVLFSGTVLSLIDAAVVVCAVAFPVGFLLNPIFNPGLEAYLEAVLGGVLLVAAAYAVTAWAAARAAIARAILAPRDTDDLGERLVEAIRSRTRLVDAFELERRRIERDLHDGAQQRLVALTMHLGLARLEAPDGSPVSEPLAKAHELAKQALTELRELIRGVHPKVLTDRGLAAAVLDVASRSPVPVDVDIRLSGRLPELIEVTAYFVVVEALANVSKHSGATRATVSASTVDGRTLLQVRDNGAGGADPATGTGLAGLVDRVAVVDGTVALSSPPGGPTVLQVEFPAVAAR